MGIKLQCPLCQQPLLAAERGAQCDNRHQFDRARQGYLNLLPVQKKRSLQPGDNPEMVEARHQFLQQGYYQPLSDRINQLLIERLDRDKPATLLDIGCGEGYYSNRLQNAATASGLETELVGLDISKAAIRKAAAQYKKAQWLVASSANIPLQNNSIDAALMVFSRFTAEELHRVMKPNTPFLVVSPAEHHLLELRQQIYQEVQPHDSSEPDPTLEKQFTPIHSERCRFEFTLTQQQLQALLMMTPHGHRMPVEKRQEISKLNDFNCQADFQLTLFECF